MLIVRCLSADNLPPGFHLGAFWSTPGQSGRYVVRDSDGRSCCVQVGAIAAVGSTLTEHELDEEIAAASRWVIHIDFGEHLLAEGFPRDEAADFAGAWRGAIGWIAASLKVEIGDSDDRRGRLSTSTPLRGETIEGLLYQAACDCLSRDDAPVGDRWTWDEKPAVLERVRAALSTVLP